jgi:hypothetical protein
MTDELSSDILEKQFGPTQIDVLHHDEEVRFVQTRVKETGQILELSFVGFHAPVVDKFEEIRQEVMNGKSLGKAFRDRGVAFVRQQQVAVRLELPDVFGKKFASSGLVTVVAATIVVGDEQLEYAEVLETYSPDVSWPEIGGELSDEQSSKLELLTKFVESI